MPWVCAAMLREAVRAGWKVVRVCWVEGDEDEEEDGEGEVRSQRCRVESAPPERRLGCVREPCSD